jgi:flagellar hook-associated protein 2
MPAITSLGIGTNGLDVNSIVSKLTALERQPLTNLQTQAKIESSQISSFAQVQSEFSALTDAATAMSTASAWTARNASSSNANAAAISVDSTADATSFTLDVDALAKQQSTASSPISGAVGAGTLTIRLGKWDAAGTTFTPSASSSDVTVTVGGTDTVATIAAAINKSNAGVVATAFNDGTQDRLLIRSKDTGATDGFRIQATSTAPNAGGADLTRLAFDPQNSAGVGMATSGNPTQFASDAIAHINGLKVTSASNTLTGNIPGVTINLLNTTTTNYDATADTGTKSPLTMTVSENVTPAVQNVQNFVDAYNKLASDIANLTKYDAATKTPSLFQGDSSVLGMQSVLRSMVGSSTTGSSVYSRLSDVGIELQTDGTKLGINTTKLAAAANNGTELQKFFTTDNKNPLTDGFAIKFKNFGAGVIASGGTVDSKAKSLQDQLKRNGDEQQKVNDRADALQARLTAQYSALDGQMASINALAAYVSQQVATWNKSTA